MTLYAVGDLQGCLEPLQTLLAYVEFNPNKDHLWLTGDLVNRGPDSIGCLRFVRDLGNAAQTVLGNHDLHLLAVHELQLDTKDDDVRITLNHPEASTLLNWLAQQPLLIRDKTRKLLMTHAGIPPVWTDKQACRLAEEVDIVLADPIARKSLFKEMYGNKPNRWKNSLGGSERLRYIINAFTRMRFCDAQAKLEFATKAGPMDAPTGLKPWYAWNTERKHKIVFGHWASLMGNTQNDNFIGLDTGYVWGNYLTLINLDTHARYCCDTQGHIWQQ